MATVSPTTEYMAADRKVVKFTWATLANGDSGDAVEFSSYNNRSVQVHGTFGAAGSVLIEGSSNDEVTYATLHDPTMATVVFAAAGIVPIADLAELVRPRVTAGDVTTSLTVTLLCWIG